MKSERLVQVALGCISVGQIVVAGMTMLSGKGGIDAASRLYGADFKPHKQFSYIIRPLGAYMLALSIAQLAAVRKPRRNKRIIDATILLFAIRQAQRWVLRESITETFGIAPRRFDQGSIFFAFWGIVLLIGRVLMGRDES
jgi:hypothetical protein